MEPPILHNEQNHYNIDNSGLLVPLELTVVSPVKCVKNEIHNILTVLKLTKQFISANRFRVEVCRDEESLLVQSFQQLFDSLTYVDEFHLDSTHLQPFIEVIESPLTAGPITAVALAAINKFVVYGLIQATSPGVASSINMLANGVLNTRFQGSDSPTDEVVMLKILSVLIDTLRCSAGEFLTDETVWQMVKKAYQISRQPRASYLLRSSSENILQQMVLSIFGCHKTRSTHVVVRPKSTNDAHTVGGVEVLRPYGIECMFKTLKFLAYLTSYGTRAKQSNFRMTSRDSSSVTIATNGSSIGVSSDHGRSTLRTRTPPRIRPSCRTPTPTKSRSADRVSIVDDKMESIGRSYHGPMKIEDELALPFVQPSNESVEFCEEMRTLGLSLLNIALERGGEEVAKCPLLIEVIQDEICKALLLNARTESLFLLSVTLRCVFNLFVYLKQHLKVQLEVFFNSIHLRVASAPCESDELSILEQRELALESLLEFCREPDLMVELYENYDCDVHCTNLFERLVQFLSKAAVPEKLRSETSGISSTKYEQREPLLEGQRRVSIERETIEAPVFSALHRLALSGLLSVIHSVASRCRFDPAGAIVRTPGVTGLHSPASVVKPFEISVEMHKKGIQQQDIKVVDISGMAVTHKRLKSRDGLINDEQRQAQLKQQKEWKRRLELAASLFNTEPNRCIIPLQNLSVISDASAQSLAEFLRNTPGLDVAVIGEYLCKPIKWNAEVRSCFLKTFEFQGMCVVDALKLFLTTFKLPGEAQQIERIMEAFANQYFDDQVIPKGAISKPPANKLNFDESKTTINSKTIPSMDDSPSAEVCELGQRSSQCEDSSVKLIYRLYTPRWIPTERGPQWQASSVDYSGGFDGEGHQSQEDSEQQGNEKSEIEPIKSRANTEESLVSSWANYPIDGSTPPGAVLMSNVDTIFILGYSIIMLNTDLHNPQVKHKMKPEEFIRNNRGIDDGQNLPAEYLVDIYERIRDNPIRLHDDRLFGEEQTEDEEYWDKILSKQGVLGQYSSTSLQRAGLHERDMFNVLLQSNVVDAIFSAFRLSHDLNVINNGLTGILELGLISTYFSQPAPLALIMQALSQHVNYWMTLRCQLAVPVIIQITSMAAHLFREECWLSCLEVLEKLLVLGLLPGSLTEFDDFPELFEGRSLQQLAAVVPPPLRLRITKPLMNDFNDGVLEGKGSWLLSLASLLFDNNEDGDDIEEKDSVGSTSPSSDVMFCYYNHSGWPTKQDGRPVIFDGISRGADGNGIKRSLSSPSSAAPASLFQSLTVSSTLDQLARVLVESPCSYFSLKAALADVYKVDELLMDRFRHLPLQSLSSFVGTLISSAHPPAVRSSLADKLNHPIVPQCTVQRPARGVIRAVVPDVPAVEIFRADFDPLFCLELLTNLVCIRLHVEETSTQTRTTAASIGGSSTSHTRVPGDFSTLREESFSESRNLQTPNSNLDGSISTCKPTFSNTLWPLVISYLESALRWYLITGATSRLPRIISVNDEQSRLVLPDGSLGAELESLPSALNTLAFLKIFAVTTPKSHLERPDLMFAERLIVSVLRLCVRLSHTGEDTARLVLCGFLRLFAHLHSDLYLLHTERIIAALHQLFVVNHLVVADAYAIFMTALRSYCVNRGSMTSIEQSPRLLSLFIDSAQLMKSRPVDETIIALLAVCQRCAPLRLPPFLVSKSRQSEFPVSSSALAHAVLDVLNVWLSDRTIVQYLLLPDWQAISNTSMQTPLNIENKISSSRKQETCGFLHPSATFISTVQTLLLFLLVRPDDKAATTTVHPDKQQRLDSNSPRPLGQSQSVAGRAFGMLQDLYAPVFEALQHSSIVTMNHTEQQDTDKNRSVESSTLYDGSLEKNGLRHSAASIPSTDIELRDPFLDSRIGELIKKSWHLWLFPILHSYSVIAAFCPEPSVRREALSLIQRSLTTEPLFIPFNADRQHKYTETNNNDEIVICSPTLWSSVVFELILLPLISYQYSYPFPLLDIEELTRKQHVSNISTNDDNNLAERPTAYQIKIWMADSLRLLLTPEGSQASLGIPELSRRKAQSIGFVCRHVLNNSETLVTAESKNDVNKTLDIVGDLLLSVVAQLLHRIAIESWTASVHLQDSCVENLKNVVLVLSATFSNSVEFNQRQSQLNVDRFAINLTSLISDGRFARPAPPGHYDSFDENDSLYQSLSQLHGQSLIILRLSYHILRRVSRLDLMQDVLSALPRAFHRFDDIEQMPSQPPLPISNQTECVKETREAGVLSQHDGNALTLAAIPESVNAIPPPPAGVDIPSPPPSFFNVNNSQFPFSMQPDCKEIIKEIATSGPMIEEIHPADLTDEVVYHSTSDKEQNLIHDETCSNVDLNIQHNEQTSAENKRLSLVENLNSTEQSFSSMHEKAENWNSRWNHGNLIVDHGGNRLERVNDDGGQIENPTNDNLKFAIPQQLKEENQRRENDQTAYTNELLDVSFEAETERRSSSELIDDLVTARSAPSDNEWVKLLSLQLNTMNANELISPSTLNIEKNEDQHRDGTQEATIENTAIPEKLQNSENINAQVLAGSSLQESSNQIGLSEELSDTYLVEGSKNSKIADLSRFSAGQLNEFSNRLPEIQRLYFYPRPGVLTSSWKVAERPNRKSAQLEPSSIQEDLLLSSEDESQLSNYYEMLGE